MAGYIFLKCTGSGDPCLLLSAGMFSDTSRKCRTTVSAAMGNSDRSTTEICAKCQ